MQASGACKRGCPLEHPSLHVLTQAAISVPRAQLATLPGPPLSKTPFSHLAIAATSHAALAHICTDWPGRQSPGRATPTLCVSPPIAGHHTIHKPYVPSPVNMDQSFATTSLRRMPDIVVLAVRCVDPAHGARDARRKQLGLTASTGRLGPSVEFCTDYTANVQCASGPAVPFTA